MQNKKYVEQKKYIGAVIKRKISKINLTKTKYKNEE
jgi:hypothetical protein